MARMRSIPSTVSAAASKFPSAPEERVGVVDVDYHAALAEVNKVRSGPRGDWDPSAAALVLLGSSAGFGAGGVTTGAGELEPPPQPPSRQAAVRTTGSNEPFRVMGELPCEK
jgi:hypothetical protein